VSTGEARFPLVDALRAIAALLVLAYHCAFVLGGFGRDGLGPWLAQLNVGIVLFFAISGFLLYRPFVAARLAGTPSPELRAYTTRRFLRIVPAYWTALTLIALTTSRESVLEPGGLLTYYGFLQSYRTETVVGGIGQAWTLGAEVAFYALLPIIALIAVRRRAAATTTRGELAFLAGLFVFSVAWKVGVTQSVDARSDDLVVLLIALPGQLDHFVLGMALAVVSASLATRDAPSPRTLRVLERAPALPWTVAGAAFFVLGADWQAGGETGRVLGEHALRGVVALGLLLPAVIGADGGGVVRWLLARRFLAWIGLVSYGVYLWHLDILRELVEAGFAGWIVAVAGTVLSLAAGALSWYGVERRALALGRRPTKAQAG